LFEQNQKKKNKKEYILNCLNFVQINPSNSCTNQLYGRTLPGFDHFAANAFKCYLHGADAFHKDFAGAFESGLVELGLTAFTSNILKPLMESSVFSSALMMVYPWSSANCPYRP
jgi:hypothetical protein